MVSVEDRYSINDIINGNPKSALFNEFLNGEAIDSDTNEILPKEYIHILTSIRANDSNKFSKIYEEYSKRNLDKDSPFVYDNYLIFALIVGALKFDSKVDWLLRLIMLREQNRNEPERSITISFKGVITSDFLGKECFHAIILSALVLANNGSVDIRLIKNAIATENNLMKYIAKDPFLGSILLFSAKYTAIFSLNDNTIRLIDFERRFLQRVSIIRDVIYAFVILSFAGLWFKMIKANPEIEEYANKLDTFLGLFGIVVLGLLNKKIRDGLEFLLFRMLGYKKSS